MMTTAKAKTVETSLRTAGLTGIDWGKLLPLLLSFLSMFTGGICPIPVATRRMRSFGRSDQWYAGRNLDERRVRRTVEDSDVLTGEGDNPATVDDVVAAFKDVAGNITTSEVAVMFSERGT